MEKPPKNKSGGDAIQIIAKTGLGAVPVVGGTIKVLFENIFTEPLAKRRQAWLDTLAEVITELEKKVEGLTPERLSENSAFISLSLHASQIALRIHEKEKLLALRNAIFNSALPDGIDETIQSIFIRFVDDFTPLHLKMLSLLNEPTEWMKKENVANPGWGIGGISHLIEHCLPYCRSRKDLYSQVFKDLQARGLLNQGQILNATMSGPGITNSHTTDFGKQFLNFISMQV